MTRARRSTGANDTSPWTLGPLLCVLVTAASVQDRDGARPLLEQLRASCGRIRLVWADGAYAGKLVDWALTTAKVTTTIVKRIR